MIDVKAEYKRQIARVMADNRERTMDDLRRALNFQPGDGGMIARALQEMAMAGLVKISSLYGVTVYRRRA